jgi:CDGSH-type Zn-finger protein
MPNGPFVVDASVPLRRRAIVMSEHGEPLTYAAGEPLETEDVYALCRCGGSSHKPFCDGTHNRNGFDGTDGETATTAYAERSTGLGGTRITIHDDRSICVHAGFCGNRVTNVWKMAGAVDDDTVVRAQVMAMIEKCPSGALTYRLEGDDTELEQLLPEGIAVLPDGPLAVTGRVTVDAASGSRIENRNRVTLCRCGQSKNKPLCDGTHGDVGFVG